LTLLFSLRMTFFQPIEEVLTKRSTLKAKP